MLPLNKHLTLTLLGSERLAQRLSAPHEPVALDAMASRASALAAMANTGELTGKELSQAFIDLFADAHRTEEVAMGSGSPLFLNLDQCIADVRAIRDHICGLPPQWVGQVALNLGVLNVRHQDDSGLSITLGRQGQPQLSLPYRESPQQLEVILSLARALHVPLRSLASADAVQALSTHHVNTVHWGELSQHLQDLGQKAAIENRSASVAYLPRTDGWIVESLHNQIGPELAAIARREPLLDADWAHAYEVVARFVERHASTLQALTIGIRVLGEGSPSSPVAARLTRRVTELMLTLPLGTLECLVLPKSGIPIEPGFVSAVLSRIEEAAGALGAARSPQEAPPALHVLVALANACVESGATLEPEAALQVANQLRALQARNPRIVPPCLEALGRLQVTALRTQGPNALTVASVNAMASKERPSNDLARGILKAVLAEIDWERLSIPSDSPASVLASGKVATMQDLPLTEWLALRARLIKDPTGEDLFPTLEALVLSPETVNDKPLHTAVLAGVRGRVRAGKADLDRIAAWAAKCPPIEAAHLIDEVHGGLRTHDAQTAWLARFDFSTPSISPIHLSVAALGDALGVRHEEVLAAAEALQGVETPPVTLGYKVAEPNLFTPEEVQRLTAAVPAANRFWVMSVALQRLDQELPKPPAAMQAHVGACLELWARQPQKGLHLEMRPARLALALHPKAALTLLAREAGNPAGRLTCEVLRGNGDLDEKRIGTLVEEFRRWGATDKASHALAAHLLAIRPRAPRG